MRAGFERPSTPQGDREAQARLCAGMRSLPTRAGAASDGSWSLTAHLEARTRFFDGQVLDAVSTGIRQIVIAGAGYDDRALRFRSPGVRYFELDRPDTQDDKRRRVADFGADVGAVSFIGADFRHDDVDAELGRAGHDDGVASLFICEGLLVYLDAETVLRLLGGLARRAAPGSLLAASLAVRPAGYSSEEYVALANARRVGSGEHEPWRTILSLPEHVELCARAGWEVRSADDDSAFSHEARPGRSLMMVAVPRQS